MRVAVSTAARSLRRPSCPSVNGMDAIDAALMDEFTAVGQEGLLRLQAAAVETATQRALIICS